MNMHHHRYNTRSKSSKASLSSHPSPLPAPNPAPPAAIDSTQSPATEAEHGRHEDGMEIDDQSDDKEMQSDASQPDGNKPALFRLPPELQTMIYEYAVVNSEPIYLHVTPIEITKKVIHWRLFINSNLPGRPPILATCRYLRSFVTPIYLAGNTFSTNIGHLSENKKLREVLRHMWGEDVKHMRSVRRVGCLSIRWRDFTYPFGVGLWELEVVDIITRVKLLESGLLVLSRHNMGTHRTGLLPKGEICHCELEALVEKMGDEARYSSRLWEIAGLCVYEDWKTADVKICEGCGLHRVVLVEK